MEHTASPTLGDRPTELPPDGLAGPWARPAFDGPPVLLPPADAGFGVGATHEQDRKRNLFRRLMSESGAVVLIAFAAYLTVALLLDFKYQILPLDAVSRMANGYYVLWSRDPHLAAVGFVWSPLQSFADIPFLVFRPLFPVLATHELAGSLVSVLAGVGAVHQVHAALTEWQVRRGPRLVLTLVFAVNPMVVYYAGNGMSDMLYMFLLTLTTRYLLRWLHEGDLRSLVYSGSALGAAYLDRYEAIGAAGLAAAVVLVVSSLRSQGRARARIMAGSADTTIFLLPLIATFVSWAVMSYVITGQLFPGISSQYGTGAQTSEAVHLTFGVRLAHDVHNLEYLAPLLPLVLVLAVVFSARRRDIGILAPLAVLGGSVLFDAVGLLVGFLEPWYRYFIVSVPLDVMLVGCILAQRRPVVASDPGLANDAFGSSSVGSRRLRRTRRTKALVANVVGIVAVVALLGVSAVSSGMGIFAGSVQSSESTELGALFLSHPTKNEKQWTHHYALIQSIDAYIGNMDLPDGSIVADTYGNCTPQIVTSVPNSKIFVIINDRDFERVLADPLTFDAHYLFVPDPGGVGAVDALNEQYPTLYKDGAGFAKLVHQFKTDGICATYRLYRVTGHNGRTS